MVLFYHCGKLVLDYSPTGSRLSDVAIAGITIGGFFALVLIGTSVIVGIICWRHNHANRTTQQPDQQVLLPSLPSNNPPPYRHANRTTQQPDQQVLLPSLPSNNPPPYRHANRTTQQPDQQVLLPSLPSNNPPPYRHANRTTQQPDQQVLLPSLPSNNPPPYRQTQLPAVCYANLEYTGPEPQYIPESRSDRTTT